MKRLLLILTLLFSLTLQTKAQLKKTWKEQIYVGYNRILGGKNFVNSKNFDVNYVTKSQWLFNSGLVTSKYISPIYISRLPGFSLSAKPRVYVTQFNLSAGKRFDVLPKVSFSIYGGLSYTHCKYPYALASTNIKFTRFSYPITFSNIAGRYAIKNAIGIRLNGEININLCENLSVNAGYMVDINKAHPTGGLSLGIRIGVIKQKYGTRNISKITF